MRVIKDNTLRYQSFYKSLPLLSNLSDERGYKLGKSYYEIKSNQDNSQDYLENLIEFQNNLKDVPEIEDVLKLFERSVVSVISCREVNIYTLDDSQTSLIPFANEKSGYTNIFINNALKEGILEWVFDSNSPRLIPALNVNKINGYNLKYMVFPLKADGKNRGVITVLSQVYTFTEESIESKTIMFMGQIALTKIDLLKKNKELVSAYKDQQTYQSKLFNDYKLSAVGELTTGIAQEILSPLQVISSHVDLLQDTIDYSSSEIIKNQIAKMESVVRRLIKFASQTGDNVKIFPCDINSLIEEYHKLLSSTLSTNKFECVLNLGESIPPVLSNPDYIFQLLSNVFNIINSSGKNGGGIVIQTKYVDEHVNIRIVSTEFLPSLQNKDDAAQLNLRIIYNIMKKHEGELKTATKESAGSVIVLSFPLKRKIR